VVYDSILRAVWAKKGSKPIIMTTGSHRKTYVFGALSLDKRQMFRQYKHINRDTTIMFLREMRKKFKCFLLFMDKAPWHKKDRKVSEYLENNKHCIKVMWFPTASPELNPVEECWRQSDKDVLGNTIYPGFEGMKAELAEYLRTKRFKLDMVKYLCH
jgi:hypothetical protein